MNYIQASIIGVVEGLTEFLPISSTFHLQLTSSLLGLTQTEFVKLFEIAIQSGAILAALLLNFNLLQKNKQLITYALISFLPTAVIGFVLHSFIKNTLFNSPLASTLATIIVALVFLFFEWQIKAGKLKLHKDLAQLTIKDCLLIGLFQALAILPGVSRAGIVLITLFRLGFKRTESATFSFLIAIPTIFAATALDLVKNKDLLVNLSSSIPLLAIGFVCAFVSAVFVIRWFVNYLKSKTLAPFAYYRLFLGALLLAGLLRLS